MPEGQAGSRGMGEMGGGGREAGFGLEGRSCSERANRLFSGSTAAQFTLLGPQLKTEHIRLVQTGKGATGEETPPTRQPICGNEDRNPPAFPNSGRVEVPKPGLDGWTAEEQGSGQSPGARRAHRVGSERGAPQQQARFLGAKHPKPFTKSDSFNPQLWWAPW